MSGNLRLAVLQFSCRLDTDGPRQLGLTRGIPRLIAHLLQSSGLVQCEVRDLQRDDGAGGVVAVHLDERLSDEDAVRLTAASTNNAGWCLHGLIESDGDALVVHYTLLDTATPDEAALDDTLRGQPGELGGLLFQLAAEIQEEMSAGHGEDPLDEALLDGLSTDFDALMAYLAALASVDFDERIELLHEAVAADPTFTDAAVELTQSYLVNRQFKEAEALLVESTSRDKVGHAKLCELALVFFTRGMTQEAVYLARKAMIWQPGDADSYVPYIRIALVTGNVGDGLKYTQRAEQLAPDNPAFQAFMSLFYRYMQDYPKAIHYAQRAIEMGPDEAFHYYALGSAHLFSRNVRAALRHFEKALELNPYDTATHRELGLATCELYEGAEARERLDRSLELLPGDAFLLTLKARTWVEDDPAQAQFCLERALQINPGFPDAHGLLGQVLREQGDYERATKHIETALQLDHSNPKWYREQGKLLVALDRPEEAQHAFQRALELEE